MILAIDTSSTLGSIALGEPGRVIEEATFREGRERHSATLFTALAKLDLPKRAAGISSIVVGLGPGSFSGIRVALAAAQGLALPCAVPVRGICSAWSVAQQWSDEPRLGVFADARRGDYYCTIYAKGRLERSTFLLPRGEAAAVAATMSRAVSADPLADIAENTSPRATDYLSATAADWIEGALLEPIYLREAVG